MAREGLGLVGAGVGFLVGGGPIGMQIGFAVGSAIGGYIDPVEVPHPGLGEAPIQTGREGIDIPEPWGLCHCSGNVIDQGDAYDVSKKRRSGKNAKVEEITRFKTFAIGVCAGPIDSISRIWENNRLVYDINGTLPAEDHADFESKITIYTGSDDQLPDPDLEVIHGVGQVPAYRDLAYVCFPDYDVTDTAGAIPMYRFEINGSVDLSVTSKPYPIETLEGLEITAIHDDRVEDYAFVEGAQGALTVLPGALGDTLKRYSWPPEGKDGTLGVEDGTLDAVLKTYDLWPPEGQDGTLTPQDGTLDPVLITYTNWPEEGQDGTLTPQDGTLV